MNTLIKTTDRITVSSVGMVPSPRHLSPGVSQSTLNHFSNIPWTSITLDDAAFQIVQHSRTVTHDGKGHTLTGRTWNTDSTIKELLSLWRPSASSTPTVFPQSESERAEVRRFYTFGDDLNAHPSLLHGGVIASILDSTMGGCVGISLLDPLEEFPMFTVQLNITYKKPVKTPGTVMLRSWITKVDGGGRKVWAHGIVESEDGIINATADGLWLRSSPGKSKL